MARGRMINKKISLNKTVNDLSSDTCRLAFTWTIAHLDCQGRISGDPLALKAIVFPRRKDITEEQFEGFINEWATAQLIDWYEANGDKWIQFKRFSDNQTGLRPEREKDSSIPGPETGIIITGFTPKECRSKSGVDPEVLPHKLREEKINIREYNIGDSDESLVPETDPISVPEEDANLYTSIKTACLSEQPHHRFKNYGKEGKAIKELIREIRARAPDDMEGFIKRLLETFKRMKEHGSDFWKGQPFLPSALNSAGIFERLVEEMSRHEKEQDTSWIEEVKF